jgi:MFS family permease
LSLIFAWCFIDPHLPFYVFDELGWTTAQFGSAISFYGWALLIGSLALGQSSDRIGRKSVLIIGLLLHSAQYIGFILTNEYWVIIVAFILAGLGESLVTPALSASFLDITPEEHRARVMGIKTAIGSLGSLSAPALVMFIIRLISPQNVFLISAALILLTGLVVLVALRLPTRGKDTHDLVWEVSQERILAAQSALNNVALSASTARKLKGTS